jgi:hypothetical protein
MKSIKGVACAIINTIELGDKNHVDKYIGVVINFILSKRDSSWFR